MTNCSKCAKALPAAAAGKAWAFCPACGFKNEFVGGAGASVKGAAQSQVIPTSPLMKPGAAPTSPLMKPAAAASMAMPKPPPVALSPAVEHKKPPPIPAAASMAIPKPAHKIEPKPVARQSAPASSGGFDPSAFDQMEELDRKPKAASKSVKSAATQAISPSSPPMSPKKSATAAAGFDPNAFDAFEQLDHPNPKKSSTKPAPAQPDPADDSPEEGDFWCVPCGGLLCGPMDKFKCDCGHYVRDHTDIKPAHTKPRVRPKKLPDTPTGRAAGTYKVDVAKPRAPGDEGRPESPRASAPAAPVNKPGPRPGTSICPTCQKVVYAAEKITAVGVDYHPICLRCSNPVCKKQIFSHSLVAAQGRPWCSLACTDIKNHAVREGGNLNAAAASGENCAKCGAWISEGAFIANGLKYHKHCHESKVCLKCGGVVAGKYVGSNGAFYHAECFGLGAPCPVCGEKLTGKMTSIGGIRLHARCFNCRSCGKNIISGYLQKGDDYFCENCYNEKHAPLIVETVTTYADGSTKVTQSPASGGGSVSSSGGDDTPRRQPPVVRREKVAEAEVFDDTKKDDYVLLLAAGATFLKHGVRGAPHEREFFMANNMLFYCEPGKRMIKSAHGGAIDLTALKMVLKGKQTEELQRESAANVPDEHCFTIVGERSLNCECPSKDVRDRWVEAFFYFRHVATPMVQSNAKKSLKPGGTLWQGLGTPKDKKAPPPEPEEKESKTMTSGTLQQQPGMRKIRIAAGAKEAVSFMVTKPPAAINWNVLVQDKSVFIECIFRPSDAKLGAAEPAHVKIPPIKVRSEEGIQTGCFAVDGPGELLFTLDNSKSLMTEKIVDFKFEVLES